MKNSPIKTPDQRSTEFIFVPFCLTCQAFQAQGIVRYGFSATIKPVIEELLTHDVNIIQMPCPESYLGGLSSGLKRSPKGIKSYDTPEFRKICSHFAKQVVDMIKAIEAVGYQVVGILGMEYSPSCGVDLQYSRHEGTVHRPGIFVEILQQSLARERITIPFVGINRRGIQATIKKIRALFPQQKELFS